MASVFIHPSAVVDPGAVLGEDTKVWHFSHVSAGARLGAGCVLGQNVFVASTVVVGDRCRIQNNVSLYDGVRLEDDVFIGPSAVFTNVVNPRAFVSRKSEFRPTVVARGASVGANATVVCGHDIGPFAFIGAGAVVTADVPAYGLVVGVPGRWCGWVCRCGQPFPRDATPARLTCARCGLGYVGVRDVRGRETIALASGEEAR